MIEDHWHFGCRESHLEACRSLLAWRKPLMLAGAGAMVTSAAPLRWRKELNHDRRGWLDVGNILRNPISVVKYFFTNDLSFFIAYVIL